MPEQPWTPDLASVLEQVVLPAVRAVLRPEEPDHLSLRIDADGTYELVLRVGDDVVHDQVVQPQAPSAPHEWRERLTSNLVDWVAESGFGWGQDRSHGPA